MTEQEWIDMMVERYQMSEKEKKEFLINKRKYMGDRIPSDPEDLEMCFLFPRTPQGWTYWNKIYERNPVELNEDEFQCNKCKKIHTKNSYAIAQKAMGHHIVFTCSCGNKINL